MLNLVVIFLVSVSLGTAVDIGDVDIVQLLRDEDPQNFDGEIEKWALETTPGTLWCGEELKTDDENELGEFAGTDSCCRDHFLYCDSIDDGETKHGLENTFPFSIAACSCDYEFMRCLQKVDESIRPELEFKFFGILHPPCFIFTNQKEDQAEVSKPVRDNMLADEIERGDVTLDLDELQKKKK